METLNKTTQESMSPREALDRLLEGNRRFVEGRPVERDLRKQVEETSGGQFPSAVVLTCIDSRTPPELILDQGLGDVFSVRLAGNVVNEDALGSMEFACKVAGAKVLLVLGHTHCGAIKGAIDGVELGNLTSTMKKLAPVVERARGSWNEGTPSSAEPKFVESVARSNVAAVLEDIHRRSDVLRELAESGAIEVVGGLYDVVSGRVELLKVPVS